MDYFILSDYRKCERRWKTEQGSFQCGLTILLIISYRLQTCDIHHTVYVMHNEEYGMRPTCLFSFEKGGHDVVDSVHFQEHFYLCCTEHVRRLLNQRAGSRASTRWL